jgi:uncharacterized protein
MNIPTDTPRPRLFARPLARVVVYLIVGYVGLLGLLMFFENRLIYVPTTAAQHWEKKPAGVEDVELTSADGTRLHAWWYPGQDAKQTVLYCHGNAGNLSHRGPAMLILGDKLDASVLIIDYPGYGKSEGQPTEQGCYAAADAAYSWLTDKKNIAPKKIVLYGASLGGGVVTDLASRKEHRALVLIKTFSSLPDVASDLYWWLPMPTHLLMRNQMNSVSKIKQVHGPVFIAHGTADRLIPYAHGQRLYDAANQPKRFVSIPGGEHNDGVPTEVFTELKEFLEANPVE